MLTPVLATGGRGLRPASRPARRRPAGLSRDGRARALRRRDRDLRLPPLRLPGRPAALADRSRRGDPHGAHRRERPAQRRARGEGRRAARLADPDRRGRLRRTAAGRARPPRRRPAAARRADDEPAPGARQDRAPTPGAAELLDEAMEELGDGDRASCASSPAASTPRCSPTAASRRRSAASPTARRSRSRSRDPARAAAGAGRVGDLLRGRRGADQRRPLRRGRARRRCGSARDNGAVEVEVRDDGVGGADPAAGTGLRGLEDRVAALDGRLAVDSPPGRGDDRGARIPCA